MPKIHKKFIVLFLGLFILVPSFSYAFMSLNSNVSNTNSNVTGMKLQDDQSNDSSSGSLANDLQVTEDNDSNAGTSQTVSNNSSGESETDENDNDNQQLDLFDLNKEVTNNGDEPSDEVKNMQVKSEDESQKQAAGQSGNEQDKTEAPSKILKTPKLQPTNQSNVFIQKGTKTKQEKKEEAQNGNSSQSSFMGVFDLKAIQNSLQAEFKNEPDKASIAQPQNDFTKQIDYQKTKEQLKERDRERSKELFRALNNAKREEALRQCKAYYKKMLDNEIKITYNQTKALEDRAEKVMIAFSLWKQQVEVPKMAEDFMKKASKAIKKNGKFARWYLFHETLQAYDKMEAVDIVDSGDGDDLYSSVEDECSYVEDAYLQGLESGVFFAQSNVDNQSRWLYDMKVVIEEFTKEHPFDRGFMYDLGCAFFHDYIDNLPPESSHHCEKRLNRFHY